jgi:hypothetical protein
MRQLLTTLVFLFLAAPAFGSDCPRSVDTEEQLSWIKAESKVFEQPGAGYAVTFRGWYGFGTVYIYDNGISDWTDGVSDARLRAQIDEVSDGLRELERRGRYADLSIADPTTRKLHCRDFLFQIIRGKLDGKSVQSTASVSVRNGKLFKIRATFYVVPPSGIEQETEALARLALSDEELR